jgi:hypothetical protein
MASIKDQNRLRAPAAALAVLAFGLLTGCGVDSKPSDGSNGQGTGGAATSNTGTGGQGSSHGSGGMGADTSMGATNGSGGHKAAGMGGSAAHGGMMTGSGGAPASSGSGGSDGTDDPMQGDDGGAGSDPGSDAGQVNHASGALPPVNASFDYQLGGAYTPPDGVKIVSRDRTEHPASGLYNICYINGFQIQPGEESMWSSKDLVLRDSGGDPVVDEDWGETLIDVSTPEKRTAVAGVIGGWIQGCKDDGFDAVEIDNLDSYSRSSGLLSEDDAVATIALFADKAHAVGMPIAQKNSSELVSRKSEMKTDFAVAEECNRYSECDAYTSGYGDHVLVIEYRQSDFTKGCSDFPNLSIVLRDVDLVTPSDSAYVYDGC